MPDLRQAWAFLEQSDRICDESEIHAAIGSLARDIEARLKDAYPLVLVVMGGAVVFAGQLLPRLRFPLDLDYLHATRYGVQTKGGGLHWRVSPPQEARGRTVLLLDDILDHGQTLGGIRDQLIAQGAAQVLSAVLVEKLLPAPKPIAADFVGLRIPDRFVFGFGMDAKGYWRNLPEIRAMREAA
ncbi:MAG: hypoxanthine-guanine phosphoribosyltransferase [Burkholderiales bacterium]